MVSPLTVDACGWDLLGVSLGCISLCLVLLAKLLLSIFKGRVATWMRFALVSYCQDVALPFSCSRAA